MKSLAEGLAEFKEGFGAQVELPSNGVTVHIWKPLLVEDLDIKPIMITCKSKYREELKKRNFECRGLM